MKYKGKNGSKLILQHSQHSCLGGGCESKCGCLQIGAESSKCLGMHLYVLVCACVCMSGCVSVHVGVKDKADTGGQLERKPRWTKMQCLGVLWRDPRPLLNHRTSPSTPAVENTPSWEKIRLIREQAWLNEKTGSCADLPVGFSEWAICIREFREVKSRR